MTSATIGGETMAKTTRKRDQIVIAVVGCFMLAMSAGIWFAAASPGEVPTVRDGLYTVFALGVWMIAIGRWLHYRRLKRQGR